MQLPDLVYQMIDNIQTHAHKTRTALRCVLLMWQVSSQNGHAPDRYGGKKAFDDLALVNWPI